MPDIELRSAWLSRLWLDRDFSLKVDGKPFSCIAVSSIMIEAGRGVLGEPRTVRAHIVNGGYGGQ
jgi:hypothetical protein